MSKPEELLEFWKSASSRCKAWASCAQLVGLVVPSSAMCERIFSIVQRHFHPERRSMLRDALELGVMLSYNRYRDELDDF